MAEPINLDELLEVKEDKVDTTETTDTQEDTAADDSAEGQGVDDVNENSSSSNEENLDTGNEGGEESEEEVYVNADGSIDTTNQSKSTEDGTDQSDETSTTDSTPKSEYKFKDDFIKKAVDYYEKFGTLQPFLEATQMDYDSFDDQELLRAEFDKEYADLPKKTREKLFQKSLEKYNLDSFEEDDVEVGQAILKRDANIVRQKLKAGQQEFLQSIESTQSNQETNEAAQEQLRVQQEQNRQIAKGGVESVLKNNYIKVGANGEGINFQIANPDRVVDFALDSVQFLSTFSKQDGSVDWDKWVKVVAFTENPDLFVGELIKHGKSLGRKALEAELKNFKPENKSKVVTQGDEGSDNPYDNKLDFLKGMKVIRK